MDEQIMNFVEAMNFLKIPRSTLYKLVQEGRVPATKIGRHWRFSRDVLEKWVAGDASIQTFGASKEDERDYCWQSSNRKTRDEHDCRKCLAYKTKAMDCFMLRDIVKEDLVSCKEDCKDCEYFSLYFD